MAKRFGKTHPKVGSTINDNQLVIERFVYEDNRYYVVLVDGTMIVVRHDV